MRFFPARSRRRMAVAGTAIALTVGAMTAPLANADDLRQQRKDVQEQIEHAHDDLEHSSKQVQRAARQLEAAKARLVEARAELARANGKVTAAVARDAAMQAELEQAEADLVAARADLRTGREAVSVQRTAVGDTITDIYQQGDPKLLAFASLMDSGTLPELTRRMEASQSMVGKEDRAYDDLQAAEVLLEVRTKRVAAAKRAVAEQRQAAAAHLVEMQGLQAEASTAAESVRTLVGGRRTARVAANQARQRDQRVLDRLQRREETIKQEILESARRAAQRGGGYKGTTDGFLQLPLDAPITSPFGWRTHPIYGYRGLHNGTDFGAGCGTPLAAVSGGVVISRYYDAVYGNRVHLNLGLVNGKNLTAVYNHLTDTNVQVGQRVKRGDRIGTVGTTGWSTGCHLHFTILQNGDPVQPMDWF